MASREREIGLSYASESHKRKKNDAARNKKLTDMLVITSAVSATTNTFGEFESLEVEETLQSTSPTSSPPSFSDSNAMTYTSPTANFSLNDSHFWPKIIFHSICQSIN